MAAEVIMLNPNMPDMLDQLVESLCDEIGLVIEDGVFIEGTRCVWLLSCTQLSALILVRELTNQGIRATIEQTEHMMVWLTI